MTIGDSVRELREAKELSQGDIENRTGLLRSHISQIEDGDTLPTLETLEKLARALDVPLYRLFYNGEAPPHLPNLPGRLTADEIAGARPSEGLRKKRADVISKSDNQPDSGSARR